MIERHELPARSRRKRDYIPRYIIIHTTQGEAAVEKQYSATVNWMKGGGLVPPGEGWGPSCDILIGHDGREAWFTLGGQDYHETRANWSAGFGGDSRTTYGADEYGIAIELAQTSKGERPPQATLDAAVERCAALCREYDIEPVRIPHLRQLRSEPPPSGIVGHEDTENGRRTGKWDPNKATFPWDWFVAGIQAALGEAGEEEQMSNAYIVQKGDTLGAIAQRFGQTVAQLAERNGIADPNRIEVGQVLRLTDDAPAPVAPRPDVAPGVFLRSPTLVPTGRNDAGGYEYELRQGVEVVLP